MKRFMLYPAFMALCAAPAAFSQTDGQVYQDRQANQDARVAQGEKSGEITGAEAGQIKKGEKHINREVARDKAANGGTLTKGEKAKVHHQMNKESKTIAKDKNNDAVR